MEAITDSTHSWLVQKFMFYYFYDALFLLGTHRVADDVLLESGYETEMVKQVRIIFNYLKALPAQYQSPLEWISHIKNKIGSLFQYLATN